ncbi:MAG: hypothetical protein E6929_05345 [Clostridium sp.]|nr:hypothetical protein [Clostridium sp.]
MDIVNENSWRKTISNITWGLFFTSFTFNVFKLQYILPVIGVLMLYNEFTTIRKENKWINNTWKLTIIMITINFSGLISLATPFHLKLENSLIYSIILLTFQIIFLLSFRLGLKEIFEKLDVKPERDPLLYMAIWRVIGLIVGRTDYANFGLLTIPLTIWYVYLFRSLYKFGGDLEKLKCDFKPHKCRLNNKVVNIVYGVSCIVVVGICCVASNHLNFESEEYVKPRESEARNKLVDMGFPKDIIGDIEDKDIAILKDAINVESMNELMMFDPVEAKTFEEYRANGNEHNPGKYNIDSTTIFVELPEERLYAIEYFKWVGEGSVLWHDVFSVSSSVELKLKNAKLFYERDDKKYVADVPHLKNDMVLVDSISGNSSNAMIIEGAVNYPFKSYNQGAYIFYRMDNLKNRMIVANLLNYTHETNPFTFPYVEGKSQMGGGLFAYENMHKQHYVTYTLKAYKDKCD